MGDFILYGLVIVHTFVPVWAISSYLIRRRSWRTKLSPADTPMPVSIFKTLCGLDDALKANLESFFQLEGGCFELIFAVADRKDPALIVVDELSKRYPDVDTAVLVIEKKAAANPKVNLLVQMVPHAKYDLFWLSDSNVTVDPDELDWNRAPFSNPQTGLAHNPVVGVGARDTLAAIECGYLTDTCAVISLAAKPMFNLDAITGKSILVRRETIESIGGFNCLADILADDQLLGYKVRQAGWEMELIPRTAKSVIEQRTFAGLISRHIRWTVIRFKMMPAVYPFEHLLRPIVLASLFFVTGLCSITTLVIVFASRLLLHALNSRIFRGKFPSAAALIGLPFAEFLIAILWFVPFFTNRVKWRGSVIWVVSQSRLVNSPN